jgi:ribosomal protein L34E
MAVKMQAKSDLPMRETAPAKRKRISMLRQEAILSRWESVRKEELAWMRPFSDLPLERALAYLEDLRKICEKAGHVINQRIGEDKGRMKCASCKKDLEGLTAAGRPKYLAKFDFRNKKNPEIFESIYLCSMLCQNNWARKHGGAMGGTGA